jgi:hypothetical protein
VTYKLERRCIAKPVKNKVDKGIELEKSRGMKVATEMRVGINILSKRVLFSPDGGARS